MLRIMPSVVISEALIDDAADGHRRGARLPLVRPHPRPFGRSAPGRPSADAPQGRGRLGCSPLLPAWTERALCTLFGRGRSWPVLRLHSGTHDKQQQDPSRARPRIRAPWRRPPRPCSCAHVRSRDQTSERCLRVCCRVDGSRGSRPVSPPHTCCRGDSSRATGTFALVRGRDMGHPDHRPMAERRSPRD